MQLAAFIFDVDGTLSETEELHRRAFNETFAAHGLDWNWDRPLYRELLKTTGGKERIAAYLRDYRAHEAPAASERLQELHKEKTALFTRLMRESPLELRPGIVRLIMEARRRGILVAIATTTSLPNVKALIETSFRDMTEQPFDVIAAGDEVKKKKPAPDVYHLALERLGVSASRCIAFEDSLNGLVSATAAGIATIVTPSIYTDGEDFTGALSVVSDLGEPGRGYKWLGGEGKDSSYVTASMLQDCMSRVRCA